jgi:hypothetical protein
MSRSLIIAIVFLSVLSCQNQGMESNLEMGKYHTPDDALALEEEIEIEAPRTAEPPAPPNYSLDKGSKIIKSGSMKFEVTKLEIAKTKVDTILKTCNGYYENEQFNSYGNRISYSLQLRIPNLKFDSLIAVIETGIGQLNSKNIKAKDVTEEYVDLNIRLENNLAYLTQYKEILRKAKSVKEILEVKEKIRRIEEEINSKKGRLKYLGGKVKYSTLHLELTELIKSEISNRPRFTTRLNNAFNSGFQSFLSFLIGLISLWPFLILILVLILGRKPILNKLKFRRRNTPPNK